MVKEWLRPNGSTVRAEQPLHAKVFLGKGHNLPELGLVERKHLWRFEGTDKHCRLCSRIIPLLAFA